MTKRIGIDARFYGPFGKGLGRYVQKLIENLEKIENKDPESNREYFVFLRKENFNDYEPKNPRFHKVLADYCWYTFSEQINMPRILNKYNLDLVHFPHFNVPILYFKPFVVTIHDLILLNFPTVKGTTLSPWLYKIKFWAYRITIGSAIRRAKRIFAVSEFTRKDLVKHYGNIKNKIVVTYEACDKLRKSLRKEDGLQVLKKYGLVRENCGIIQTYILYVGNAYPHKNLDRLIECFGEIDDENLKLVLIGKDDFFYEKLKKLQKRLNIENVIFAGFVPDDDLDVLYENAKLYVFPSLYEGFGLPPLEAMSRGVPVVSSNHSCMKEVLGESAYYFDGKNKEEMKRSLLRVLSDDALRKGLCERGYQRVLLYDWERMSKETLKEYEKII